MTKQLRLTVGELTDVGRRRERNQDNVTHFVPTDADLLARRGALFVVCDGMGGHAAGEIASEIAVRTIRDSYFQESEEDVVSALARSIRAANTAIYEHAREHLTHTGMGTTCVALALVGGRAFFANIGDSRAYILRDGAMRQVTLDHSWVAEQVRAGILSEEQARVHAHRNVITRSLGTQPDVTADLFIEEMREGDRVLLCSDGLHGYVEETAIHRVMQEQEPEPGVHQLIDIANGNGGPDNITAVVIHLLEVPAITDELTLPDSIRLAREDVSMADTLTRPIVNGARGRRGGTGVLQAPRLAPVEAPGQAPAAPVAAPAAGTAATAATPAATAPTPIGARPARRRRAVWATVTLRLLAVAALLFLSLSLWDVAAGPYAVTRAASQQAQHDIDSARSAAQSASYQDPSNALNALASAQQHLRHDLTNLSLDAQDRAEVQQALDTVVAPAVRTILQTYNQQNSISALPSSSVTVYTVSCPSATLGGASSPLAAVGPATAPAGQTTAPVTLYAVSANGSLYALSLDTATATATCGDAPVVQGGVKALASDQTALYALTQQGSTWQVLQIGSDGKTAVKLSQPANAASPPAALAVRGGDYYVGFVGTQPGQSGIWHFGGSDLKKPAQTVTMPFDIAALAVAASGTPFALLMDGSVVRWDAGGHVNALPIALARPVATADPSAYAASTPVPTLPPTASAAQQTPEVAGTLAPDVTATPSATASASPTGSATSAATSAATATPSPTATTTPTTASGAAQVFGGTSSLSADRAGSDDIFVGDGALPRVVRFTVNGSDLQLARQYVYEPPLSELQSVTASADGTQVFAWTGGQLVQVTLPN